MSELKIQVIWYSPVIIAHRFYNRQKKKQESYIQNYKLKNVLAPLASQQMGIVNLEFVINSKFSNLKRFTFVKCFLAVNLMKIQAVLALTISTYCDTLQLLREDLTTLKWLQITTWSEMENIWTKVWWTSECWIHGC